MKTRAIKRCDRHSLNRLINIISVKDYRLPNFDWIYIIKGRNTHGWLATTVSKMPFWLIDYKTQVNIGMYRGKNNLRPGITTEENHVSEPRFSCPGTPGPASARSL